MKLWVEQEWFYHDERSSYPVGGPRLAGGVYLFKHDCNHSCDSNNGASDHIRLIPIQIPVKFLGFRKWRDGKWYIEVCHVDPLYAPKTFNVIFVNENYWRWKWYRFWSSLYNLPKTIRVWWSDTIYDWRHRDVE